MAAPSSLPVDAPTMPQEGSGGSNGSEAGVGLPDAPRALTVPRKPKRDRRAQRTPAPEVLIPRTDVASRGWAWELVLQDVAGGPGEPPLPLAVACRRRGLPLRTVEDALARGDAADMEAARAEGLSRCLKGALHGTAETARQWAWLAERLAPKELHLPTKVHTGQDPDAAPMQVQPVLPASPQAIRAELLLVQGEIARALKAGDEEP